ncbi:hypothetical protein KO561_18795 [Radiobacillus kanasensis]|uniref:hypothetical protein n=1 Tax=Radiobacillus kanasensis TaxID=2844358 RepID=UPI001E58652D|nr:hypothetical protein [Radiobacillus kanasensis]UFT99198.1 hypothetical protein KO561_18795 [Radiobacillus kanasensis]
MDYQWFFYGGLVGILITLPISIILFIKLGIWEAFTDISGIRMPRKKQKARRKYGKTETTGQREKRTTSEIKLKKKKVEAEVASTSHIDETELLDSHVEPTALLSEGSFNETTVLGEETSVLWGEDETTLLTEEEHEQGTFFQIEEDIVIVHSKEKI